MNIPLRGDTAPCPCPADFWLLPALDEALLAALLHGTSTIGQESEETNAKAAGTSEYDWIGYMEKFLFPETVSLKESSTLISLYLIS